MNPLRHHGPALASALLMALGALLLSRLQHLQRVGSPGLRVVSESALAEDGSIASTNTVPLPDRVLDYQSRPRPITTAEVKFLPADTTYARRYYEAPDGFGMIVNVVLMGQDRTSIHQPQYCLTGQGWTLEKSEVIELKLGEAASARIPVMRLTATRPLKNREGQVVTAKAIYLYWFVADGAVTARHGERMWLMARSLLTQGVLQRWAYVSCLTICLPGQESATSRRAEEFLAAAVPRFQLPLGSAPPP